MLKWFPILLLVPTMSFAQTAEIEAEIKAKIATIKYIQSLQDETSGGFKVDAKSPPSLRATSGGVRSLIKLGQKVPNQEKVVKYVLGCLDKDTGGFAEPGGKPDVTITSIGIMAACELGIPKDQFKSAMGYLDKHAMTFEDVRIGAAAIESWGVKDCPFDFRVWLAPAAKEVFTVENALLRPKNGGARLKASFEAMRLRLGLAYKPETQVKESLLAGQLDDGGWNKKDEKASDIETAYRVVRCLYLLKTPPKDVAKLKEFLAKHRNADGGYGMKPGDPSTLSGTYYATYIGNWINEFEKK